MKRTFLIAAALTAIAPGASAQTLFDSGGFESYTLGALAGQNGWTVDNGSAYTVVGAPDPVIGTKAVRAPGGATDWAYPSIGYTPTATEIIRIEASIARNVGTTASFSYGIDVYNSAVARTTRFGLVDNAGTIQAFITARFNTSTQQFDATAAATTVLLGGAVAADTFVAFDARLNYTTKRIDLLVNGTSVTGGFDIPFADLTAANLADADFQVSSTAGATDRGFLDNYKVSVVPEPATLAVLGLGALAMRRRRRA